MTQSRRSDTLTIAPYAPLDRRVVVCDRSKDRYFRIGRAELALLEVLDGTRSAEDLRASPQGSAFGDRFADVLERFESLGLIVGSDADVQQRPAKARRSILHWTLLSVDPDRLLDLVRPALRWVLSPFFLAATAAFAVGGFVSAPPSPEASFDMRLLPHLYVLTGVLVACHEASHAVVAKHFGVPVRRLGVMLLYLRPALYCDVSGAWMLRERWKRAAIAAAGPIFHLYMAGGLSWFTAFLPAGSSVTQLVGPLAWINLFLAIANLLPFVKFDGYWIVASLIDKPRLMTEALTYLRARLRSLLTRHPRPAPKRNAWAWLTFGACAVVTTPLLVTFALLNLREVLRGAGPFGSVLWAAAIAVVMWHAIRSFRRPTEQS